MKIGLVTPYFYPLAGGVQEHVANLYLNLKACGHRVKIITSSFLTRDGGIEFDEGDVIRIGLAIPIPINGSIGQFALPWAQRSRIRKVLLREKFDILHLHEPLLPGLPLATLKEARCKLIGTFHASAAHSPGYWFGRPFLREYLERLDGRIAVSAAARDFVARYFGGEFEIIPNGIDLERFTKGKVISTYDDGWINILFVGRPDRRKGLGYLLKAFHLIKDEIKEVRLIIVGQAKKGEKKDIHFVGIQHGLDLSNYYHSAHIFCSPATGQESFGIVLLEAMAAGLPIVASDIPGYNEVIREDREGILVPPKDHYAIARAILRLIKDGDLRRSMGLKGRERVKDFSWPRIVDSIQDYYHRVGGHH